jgi:NAD(P)-dependent dehydrogenase (short-subunit alcohol dehydrogenase family)
MPKSALIVGAGSGISAAFARALARDGYKVALSARNTDKLAGLAKETGAIPIAADATKADAVKALFAEVDRALGPLDVVLFNASFRTRGPFLDLVPDDVAQALAVSSFAGFLVGQEAARRMVAQGRGAIFFTGASASVKGYAQSAPFAMGKFALRGLAQAMARELRAKASTLPISSSMAASGMPSAAAPAMPPPPTACSTPTPSPRPTWPSSPSPAAPGAWRSSCGPG